MDAISQAVGLINGARACAMKRVGVEMPFLPMDAGRALQMPCPVARIEDALLVLERLRAVKSPAELARLKKASELVIDSMIEVIAKPRPGHHQAAAFRCAEDRER